MLKTYKDIKNGQEQHVSILEPDSIPKELKK